jgi:hypothetical protein
MNRMRRPKMQVLPDSAMLEPAFTHTVTCEQPCYLKRPGKDSEPAGTFSAGSRVRLISKGGGPISLVEDAEGRRVKSRGGCGGPPGLHRFRWSAPCLRMPFRNLVD